MIVYFYDDNVDSKTIENKVKAWWKSVSGFSFTVKSAKQRNDIPIRLRPKFGDAYRFSFSFHGKERGISKHFSGYTHINGNPWEVLTQLVCIAGEVVRKMDLVNDKDNDPEKFTKEYGITEEQYGYRAVAAMKENFVSIYNDVIFFFGKEWLDKMLEK